MSPTPTDTAATLPSHTPGPWGYDPISGIVYYDDAYVRPAIAHVYAENTGDDQAEADGRLIAAAPDMLAALKYARPHLAVGYSAAQRHWITTLVDAAIAKAEGRS